MAMIEQKQGNFVAYTDDKPQTGNWFTAVYEDDYDGLLIAMCNQNGRYPHHVTALLNGLDGKRQSMDTITRLEAENRDLRARLETVEADRAAQAERMARLEEALRDIRDGRGKCKTCGTPATGGGAGFTDCDCVRPSWTPQDPADIAARALSQEGSDA